MALTFVTIKLLTMAMVALVSTVVVVPIGYQKRKKRRKEKQREGRDLPQQWEGAFVCEFFFHNSKAKLYIEFDSQRNFT